MKILYSLSALALLSLSASSLAAPNNKTAKAATNIPDFASMSVSKAQSYFSKDKELPYDYSYLLMQQGSKLLGYKFTDKTTQGYFWTVYNSFNSKKNLLSANQIKTILNNLKTCAQKNKIEVKSFQDPASMKSLFAKCAKDRNTKYLVMGGIVQRLYQESTLYVGKSSQYKLVSNGRAILKQKATFSREVPEGQFGSGMKNPAKLQKYIQGVLPKVQASKNSSNKK